MVRQRAKGGAGSAWRHARLISAWFVLVLLAACADAPASPFDAAAILCEGTWVASPHPRGPSPPPEFEQLRITITGRPEQQGVYASGTASWNGREWPMSTELGTRNGLLNPFCRYAPGHPFATSPDPEGFSFAMLIGEGALGSNRAIDELFIDFAPRAARSSLCFETDLVRYERVE